ncbi:hypothetical protein [Burkholderia ubonensis]|uniref:hypothetical protein n=1 Tax=Burkholderia ubonensis TaxID=101571 RepID=UPI0012F85704|nr:hypothetical protein [Burkholderia ubonensis]
MSAIARAAGFGCGNGGFRVIDRARIDIFAAGYEAANCGYLFGSQWTEMGAILLICMYYDRGSAACLKGWIPAVSFAFLIYFCADLV